MTNNESNQKNMSSTEPESSDFSNPEIGVKHKKRSIIKFILILLLIVLIVFSTALFIINKMLSNDSNQDKFVIPSNITEDQSSKFLSALYLTTKEVNLSEDELNQIIREEINKANVKLLEENAYNLSNINLDKVALEFSADNHIDIYAKVEYKSTNYILHAKTKVFVNKNKTNIHIDFLETHVGSIPLPPDFLIDYIKKIDQFKPYNNKIEFSKKTMIIPTEYMLEGSPNIPITIDNLKTYTNSINIILSDKQSILID